MTDTLLLDPTTWDLVLTAGNQLALASTKYPGEPVKSNAYGLAQQAACQCRTFQGELYYDVTQGVPYWQRILGYVPNASLIRAKFLEAAAQVPDVARAQFFNISLRDRRVVGQLQVTDDVGNSAVMEFATP